MSSLEGYRKLYLETPTIHSIPLSEMMGYPVYLKLENLQNAGSFKERGISYTIQKGKSKGGKHVVCASGGSAGMAAAFCAKQCCLPCTIVLPTTTPGFVADKLRGLGAAVEIHGDVWNESNEYVKSMAAGNPEFIYVHPYEGQDLWEGHGSMICEAQKQMPCKPDVVIASVGGGGLVSGVLSGLERVGWADIPVVAMETEGANCFNAAIKEEKVVRLPAITSIAKTLGSLVVANHLLETYLSKKFSIFSEVVSDKQAVDACLKFCDDHRMLVEPSCGASLSALYSNIVGKLQSEGKLQGVSSALVIVCGGNGVSLEKLQSWKQEFGL